MQAALIYLELCILALVTSDLFVTIYVFLRGEENYKLSRTEILSSSNFAQCKMKYANATQHCFWFDIYMSKTRFSDSRIYSHSSCVPAYSGHIRPVQLCCIGSDTFPLSSPPATARSPLLPRGHAWLAVRLPSGNKQVDSNVMPDYQNGEFCVGFDLHE